MKARSAPVTRYDIISQLAQEGLLAAIDQEGYITRPLQPRGPAPEPRPVPRPHADLRDIFTQGDQTHLDPRDARAGRRHKLAYWDKWRY